MVACSETLSKIEDPEVVNKHTTMVTAEVEPLVFAGLDDVSTYVWGASDRIGLYGSAKGNNSRYDLISTTEGEVTGRFYGESVAGEISAYFPYSKKGCPTLLDNRQPIANVQNYNASAIDHIYAHTIFIGTAADTHIVLSHNMGLLKITIPFEVKGIEKVRVSVKNLNEGYDTALTGNVALLDSTTPLVEMASNYVEIPGVPCLDTSAEAPVTLWALVAPGRYENFMVQLSGEGWMMNKPVKGPFVVERAKVKNCVVEDIKYDFGVGGFDNESGSFD